MASSLRISKAVNQKTLTQTVFKICVNFFAYTIAHISKKDST